jgi:Matrixin
MKMSILSWFKKMANQPARQPSRALRPRLQLEALESRIVPYVLSGSAWPSPQLITISFMPDGTTVDGQVSNLFAKFNTKFGSAATWENQFLKAAQQWAQNTNINFAVVPDSGAGDGSGSYQQGDPTFGDIRIGGFNFNSNTIAMAFLPPPANNYSVAGDIQFNTGLTFNIGSTFDIYTVAMHEFGHALGMYHSALNTAVMFPTYGSVKSGLSADDISGIQAVYGGARVADAYNNANHSSATAAVITSSINTTTDAGVINSLDLDTASTAEWFQFVAPSGSSSTLNVMAQSSGLSLLDPAVQIYNSSLTLLASGNANAYGGTATATYTSLVAGQTYYVKAYSTDKLAAFQTGEYALILNMGTGAAPTPTYPFTQLANGNPLQSGGGQALMLTPSDTLVNATTTNNQLTSADGHKNVATDSQGNYVVTWQNYGQDGSGWGVYAQRYNSQGVAQGGAFLVNTTTAGDQTDPSVAMAASGNFVIVWTSAGQDGSGLGVFGQLFSSNGAATGKEFRVNTTTAGDQYDASVAMSNSGGFVVVWVSANQDGSGLGVYGRSYNAAASLLAGGGEFRVNAATTGDQSNPSVAMDGNGDFVIAWTSAGQDRSGLGVYAQRYNNASQAQGGEFLVDATTSGDQTSPSVAMDQGGNFVIAWASYGQDAPNSWGVYDKAYNSSGGVLSGETLVNTTTAGDQVSPSAALDSSDNVLVTWSSYNQDAANSWGVYGQILQTSTGAKVDGEFLVNTTKAGDQQYASVAVSALGQAVVVWTGSGANHTAVYSQRFSLGLDALDPAAPTPSQTRDQESQGGQGNQIFAGQLGLSRFTQVPTVEAFNDLGTSFSQEFETWSFGRDASSTNAGSLQSLSTFPRLGAGQKAHENVDRSTSDQWELSDAVFADPDFSPQPFTARPV